MFFCPQLHDVVFGFWVSHDNVKFETERGCCVWVVRWKRAKWVKYEVDHRLAGYLYTGRIPVVTGTSRGKVRNSRSDPTATRRPRLGTGNLLVTCGTSQIGPISSNKVLTPYLMPCKVDGIGTFIRRDSIDHWEFLQWRNYVWDRLTNIPRFLFWECWPVTSRVRLAPTNTRNEGKTSDSRRSLQANGLSYFVRCLAPLSCSISSSWALYRLKSNGHLPVYSMIPTLRRTYVLWV